MKKKDLTLLFNKFAGREVPMIETSKTVTIGGKAYPHTEVKLADPNDPTIKEMSKLAKDNGLNLRLWWPGMMGTADFRTDRINAHIEKEADGKYRVSNKFDIG